jgi:hypothetical protein
MAFVPDFQGGIIEAPPMAGIARHVDIGQKMHLHFYEAVSPAGLTAPPFDVEGKAAFGVAPRPGFRQQGEEVPNVVEHFGVGGWIAARCTADGLLVDVDDLVQVGQPVNAVCLPTSRACRR